MSMLRALMGIAKRTFGWLVQHAGVFVARALLRPPAVDGVRIAVFAGGDITHKTERIAEALALVARYAPHRYNQLVRNLRWIMAIPNADFQFLPTIKACSIEAGWLDEAGLVDIACVVVHEATHARLWRMGFGYEPECRERVERVCLRSEAELLRRMGRERDAEATLQRIEQRWWEAS